MIIGVDFDNTIVCYDKLFYKVALKKGLVPKNLTPVKEEIRNYLRRKNKEHLWTELQGYVYGPCIFNAKPFRGIKNFFMHCKKRKICVYIISHKTLYPFLGLKHNLQEYAHQWLEKQGFYGPKIGLPKKDVFFELTKEENLNRIKKQKCTYFIDDLPEFLLEKKFPSKVTRILFNPNSKYKHNKNFQTFKSWSGAIKKIK